MSNSDERFSISRADESQLIETSKLFDLYRQFYKEPANSELAEQFLGENLNKERSVIFVAQDGGGTTLGFTQLYLSWCSVAAAPYWILYDLYVDKKARRRGVGEALMAEAKSHAKKTNACRIDLETAVDNIEAQALYSGLGYERDTHFYKYSLSLDGE